jgi:hypothetical protein
MEPVFSSAKIAYNDNKLATGLATRLATRLATGLANRLATRLATGLSPGLATRVATRIATGIATRIATGLATGCLSNQSTSGQLSVTASSPPWTYLYIDDKTAGWNPCSHRQK